MKSKTRPSTQSSSSQMAQESSSRSLQARRRSMAPGIDFTTLNSPQDVPPDPPWSPAAYREMTRTARRMIKNRTQDISNGKYFEALVRKLGFYRHPLEDFLKHKVLAALMLHFDENLRSNDSLWTDTGSWQPWTRNWLEADWDGDLEQRSAVLSSSRRATSPAEEGLTSGMPTAYSAVGCVAAGAFASQLTNWALRSFVFKKSSPMDEVEAKIPLPSAKSTATPWSVGLGLLALCACIYFSYKHAVPKVCNEAPRPRWYDMVQEFWNATAVSNVDATTTPETPPGQTDLHYQERDEDRVRSRSANRGIWSAGAEFGPRGSSQLQSSSSRIPFAQPGPSDKPLAFAAPPLGPNPPTGTQRMESQTNEAEGSSIDQAEESAESLSETEASKAQSAKTGSFMTDFPGVQRSASKLSNNAVSSETSKDRKSTKAGGSSKEVTEAGPPKATPLSEETPEVRALRSNPAEPESRSTKAPLGDQTAEFRPSDVRSSSVPSLPRSSKSTPDTKPGKGTSAESTGQSNAHPEFSAPKRPGTPRPAFK